MMERLAVPALAAACAGAAIVWIMRRAAPPPPPPPPTMAAIVARANKCHVETAWATPAPKQGEVLIRVHATSVNRLDCNQRAGKTPVPPGVTEVLGLEAAGVVVGVGSGDVGGLAAGDEVMALLPGGGYAEYVCVDHVTVMRKPHGLSWAAAASVPEAWLTAYKLVHLVGHVSAGEVVLVHAAASGVGIAAVQLIVAAGATALVTVGTRDKLELLTSRMGATGGAVRHEGPWLETIKAMLPKGCKGIDVVLDPVARDYAAQNLDILGVDGRWVLYSLLSGPALPDEQAKAFFGSMAKKRISLLATTLRTRPRPYKSTLVHRFARDVLPKLASGQMVHLIDTTFRGLEHAQSAHELMESNANAGKIVLELDH